MNRKMREIKILTLFLTTTLYFLSGCAAPPVKKPVSTLFPQTYSPRFSYNFPEQPASPSKYTVALLKLRLKPGTRVNVTGDKNINALLADFTTHYTEDFEKMLLSKGVKVIGPFDSLDEMTFPDKSRSDYIIEAVLDLEWEDEEKATAVTAIENPDIKEKIAKMPATITVKAKLIYDIREPLTNAKLSRHKIKSDPLSEDYEKLYYGVYKENPKAPSDPISGLLYAGLGGKFGSYDYFPIARTKYSAYNNDLNATGKILDELYSFFMKKTDKLISVEEFQHLEKYKQQLEQKKVY